MRDNKQFVMALREVAAGRVRFNTDDEAGNSAETQIVNDLSR